MVDRIAEFIELVKDHIERIVSQLPALVIDLLDVRFAARGGDHLRADGAQPVEALPRHLLGQDGDCRAAEQGAVKGPATAVVAGRGPDRLVLFRVEFAADQPRHEAAESRADLVRPGRKVLAHQSDDARLDPAEGGRNLEPVDPAEEARPDVVLPGDAVEVEGVDVPEADLLQPLRDLRRQIFRMAELREGRNGDAESLAARGGFFDDVPIERPDDLRHCSSFSGSTSPALP